MDEIDPLSQLISKYTEKGVLQRGSNFDGKLNKIDF